MVRQEKSFLHPVVSLIIVVAVQETDLQVKMNMLLRKITWTVQQAAITPEIGLSENGSNVLSGLLMKSGFNRYLKQRLNC